MIPHFYTYSDQATTSYILNLVAGAIFGGLSCGLFGALVNRAINGGGGRG
jgi:hypothetical protein